MVQSAIPNIMPRLSTNAIGIFSQLAELQCVAIELQTPTHPTTEALRACSISGP